MHAGPTLRCRSPSSDESGGEGRVGPSTVVVGRWRRWCWEGRPSCGHPRQRTRKHGLPGQSSRVCRSRPSGQRSRRRRHAETGCNGSGDGPGVGSHGGWIPDGRPREDRGLRVRCISASSRRGMRPLGHEQSRVRGLAGERMRGLAGGHVRGVAGGRGRGACRGLASGRGRGVAGGAGQRVRADTGASSRDLRPGRVGQGKEEMELGWGGRRGLVAGLGREGRRENPSCKTDFPLLGPTLTRVATSHMGLNHSYSNTNESCT